MRHNKLIAAIRHSDDFIITSHIDPEPDALGSELSMLELLKRLGKKAIIVNDEPVPAHYRYIEGTGSIKTIPIKKKKFGAAIVVDCPNLDRTGRVKDLVKEAGTIINIDHHVSNKSFGDFNWISPNASSAGEIIFHLYKKMHVRLSKKVAKYIYLAILTDTGSFKYSNTSKLTHEIVGELLSYGIDPQSVSSDVYENKKFNEVKLLGVVLTTLGLADNGRIAYLVCTQAMLKAAGCPASATHEFVNFARSIEGVKIAIFIREEKDPDVYKVSLRSKKDVNVNKMAANFDGGGHKNASGCTLKGPLSVVKKRLIEKASLALDSTDN